MNLFYLLITFCVVQAAVAGDDGSSPSIESVFKNAIKQINEMWIDLQCDCFDPSGAKPYCKTDLKDQREIVCDGIKSIINDKIVNPPPITPTTTVATTTVSTTEPTTVSTIVKIGGPPTVSTTEATTVSTTEPTTVSTSVKIGGPPTVSTSEATTVSTTEATTVSTTEPTTVSTAEPTTVSTSIKTVGPTTVTKTKPPTVSSTTAATTTVASTTEEASTTDKIVNPYSKNGDNSSNNAVMIAVALGCFVLGALVVIIAKLLHNHYRQKSYALPPEQEMS